MSSEKASQTEKQTGRKGKDGELEDKVLTLSLSRRTSKTNEGRIPSSCVEVMNRYFQGSGEYGGVPEANKGKKASEGSGASESSQGSMA